MVIMKAIINVQTENDLEAEVQDMINNQGFDDFATFIHDLEYGGCKSGIIDGLITYADTSAFYDRHEDDIKVLLDYTMKAYGYNCILDMIAGVDLLAQTKYSKNMLAWFAFEETCNTLAVRLECDPKFH